MRLYLVTAPCLLTYTAAPRRGTGPCSPWSVPARSGSVASGSRSGRAGGDSPPPGCPSAGLATYTSRGHEAMCKHAHEAKL